MYKFYSTPNSEILESLLGNTPSIKFSSAYHLNDPFELKFNLIIDPNDSRQRKDFFETRPDATESDFDEWSRNIKTNDKAVWYIEQDQRNTLSHLVTLCSFTEDNKNNLMWSHYSDNHRGICIKYSALLFVYLESIEKYLYSAKIKYSKLPPKIKNLDDIYNKTLKMLFNKQLEWKYEKEYRFALYSDYETDYIEIGHELIKSVYIGSRASKQTIDKVVELLKDKNIEIFYGITLGETYDVQFEKHKEGTTYMRSFWN